MVHPLASEKIWFDKSRVEEAERNYYVLKYSGASAVASTSSSLLADIKNIKDHIRNALEAGSSECDIDMERLEKLEQETEALRTTISKLEHRIATLEGDTSYLDNEIDMQRLEKLETENRSLRDLISRLEARVAKLEVSGAPAKAAPAPAAAPKQEEEEEDEDIDLFGSDEEDEEAERLKAERVAAYNARKAKKPGVIAKSNIVLDVKPWDDETDLVEMERLVRDIQMDGLVWGAAKLVAIGYGIKKLQITCVVEDDKVGTDDLEDRITGFEDHVQSMDVVSFNKL